MQTQSPGPHGEIGAAAVRPAEAPRKLLLCALAVAAVPAGILFEARPGINYLVSLLTIFAAGWFTERRNGFGRPGRLPATDLVALIFAAVCSISANPLVIIVSLWVSLWWCALAVLHRAGWRDLSLGMRHFVAAPLYAIGSILSAARTQLTLGIGQLRDDSLLPVLRGLFWAVPIVAMFFLFLAEADPTLAAWRTQMWAALQSLVFLPRLLFWAFISLLMIGVLGVCSATPRTVRPPIARQPIAARRTATERLIILGSVVLLFGLFLLLRVGALFNNPGAAAESGMTYAQGVHQGFGQLIFVVTMSALLLLALDRNALRDHTEARVRNLSFVLLGECLLILLSAWQKLALYEEAYGYTTLRVWVHVVIVGVGIALLVLVRELMLGLMARRALLRIATAALGLLWVLCVWNVPAWVVDANVARAARGHEIDWNYLLVNPAPDALPALVGHLVATQVTNAAELRCRLLKEPSVASMPLQTVRWFEWNWRRSNALAARIRLKAATANQCADKPADD
jgi:hypothetical protein